MVGRCIEKESSRFLRRFCRRILYWSDGLKPRMELAWTQKALQWSTLQVNVPAAAPGIDVVQLQHPSKLCTSFSRVQYMSIFPCSHVFLAWASYEITEHLGNHLGIDAATTQIHLPRTEVYVVRDASFDPSSWRPRKKTISREGHPIYGLRRHYHHWSAMLQFTVTTLD